MNAPGQAGGQSISVAVLIIGSLYWDPRTHRKEWRSSRFNLDDWKHVRVPIRYGRVSPSRGCSYTMVFSEGLDEDEYGQAIVVPCRQQATDVGELVDEAELLWLAERAAGSAPNGRISVDWGCVALRMNPECPLPDEIRSGWTERVSRESCYGQLNSAVDEDVVVDKSGILNIPWPKSVRGGDLPYDVLLATATNPTIVRGHYPSPRQIADRWNTSNGKKHVNYFRENQAHGIRTFQDDNLADRLRELGR